MAQLVTWTLHRMNVGSMSDQLRARMRDALLAVGRYWHTHYLKKHFRLRAFLDYPGVYKARSARYTKRKIKAGLGVSPLIWSGELFRALTGDAQIVVTEGRVSVRMDGPRWLKGLTLMHRGKFRKGPNIKSEIEAVSEVERREMATMIEQYLGQVWGRDTGRVVHL
jgi:hypothetical protein